MDDILTGKWALIDDGEHYVTGQVVGRISEDHWLVRVIPVGDEPRTQRVFSVESLTESTGSLFFDSESELEAFETFVNSKEVRTLRVVPKEKK